MRCTGNSISLVELGMNWMIIQYRTRARTYTCHLLQLTLPAHALHQCPAVTQAHLSTGYTRHEPHLLPPILHLPGPPHLRDQLITRPDWTCKSSRELLDVRGITTTKMLQQCVGRRVPGKEPVHDRTAKPHLLPGLGRGVEGVIIAIQSVDLS